MASAVGLAFAEPKSALLPSLPAADTEAQPLLNDQHNAVAAVTEQTAFAGIVLVAPFSSLPSLMLTYRLGGWIPILLPLRPFPPLARALTSRMVDKWPTADRLHAYYNSFTPKMLHGAGGRGMGSLQIVHAVNDADISFHQTEMICRRILGDEGEKCIDGSNGAEVLDVRRDGRPGLRFNILEYGGKLSLLLSLFRMLWTGANVLCYAV